MRGQSVVLRELFAFSIGVALLISSVNIFNKVINPRIADFSVNAEARSLINHFHYLIQRVISVGDSVDGVVSFSACLPDVIGGESYRVFVDGGELCVRTNGNIITVCSNLSVSSIVSGNYISGSKLVINYSSNGGVVFDNLVPNNRVCSPDSCDDGNVCTVDYCVGGFCDYDLLSGQLNGCSGVSGCSGVFFNKFCGCVSGVCSNVCGDGVCDFGAGERAWNCYADCGITNYLMKHEDYNPSNNDLLNQLFGINFGGGYVLGNQSVVFNPGGEINDFYSVVFANRSGFGFFVVDNDLYYSSFNDSWVTHRLTYSGDRKETESRLSLPSGDDSVGSLYVNCSNVDSDCDLWTNVWSGSWDSPVRVTYYSASKSVFTAGDSPLIARSFNGNYSFVAWGDGNGLINYSYFNGSWSNASPLVDEAGAVLVSNGVAVNDDGEVMLIYDSDNGSRNLLFFNGSWTNLGVRPNSSVISYDGDFMIVSLGSDSVLNTSFFDGFSFSSVTRSVLRDSPDSLGLLLSDSYGQVFVGVRTPVFLIYTLVWNSSDWVRDYNFTFCGNNACERFERCSNDCSSETWFDDGVDNDDDGIIDS